VKVHFSKAKGKDIDKMNMMPRIGEELGMERKNKRQPNTHKNTNQEHIYE